MLQTSSEVGSLLPSTLRIQYLTLASFPGLGELSTLNTYYVSLPLLLERTGE